MLWRIALALVAVLLLAAFWLWSAVTPPAPLALPEQGLTLANVTLVQPGESRAVSRKVVVRGGAIREIGPADGSDEFEGLFALPGLIDMHVHFPPDTGLGQTELFSFLYLAHGVTSVRDAADADGTSTAPARDGVAEGSFPGPRVFACGPLLDGPEPIWPNSIVLTDPADAAAAVERVADQGFDCLKAYDGLTAEVLAAIQRAADGRGLPVIGHVPRAVPFEVARLDDVQHLTGVPYAVGDLRPFPAIMDRWAAFDEARARVVVEASLAHDIAHTPTLVTTERMIAMRDYESLRRSADALLLPRFYRDVVWSPVEGLPMLRRLDVETYALLESTRAQAYAFVARLHRAGVRVHAGTDTQLSFVIPGAALHREIRLLAATGLGAEAAMAAATTVPGRSLGVPGLGRLEVGAPADLALFREDPTRDLVALDTLEAVVADGRLYPRRLLDGQLARHAEHFEGAVYDSLSTALTRRVLANLFGEGE